MTCSKHGVSARVFAEEAHCGKTANTSWREHIFRDIVRSTSKACVPDAPRVCVASCCNHLGEPGMTSYGAVFSVESLNLGTRASSFCMGCPHLHRFFLHQTGYAQHLYSMCFIERHIFEPSSPHVSSIEPQKSKSCRQTNRDTAV